MKVFAHTIEVIYWLKTILDSQVMYPQYKILAKIEKV